MIMRRTNVYGHVPNMPYFKTENACIDQNVTCYFIPHIGDVIIAGAKHVQSFRGLRCVFRLSDVSK